MSWETTPKCQAHDATWYRISKVFQNMLKKTVVLLVVCALFFPGCVRRKMTVRSNPPGATVYLDGKEIGRTPFSTNFDYYGRREFRVVKEGYETKTVIRPVSAPWYQWFPFDFVSEVVIPGKITDEKFYEFDLQPSRIVPQQEILVRAESLRHQSRMSAVRSGSSSQSSTPGTGQGYGSIGVQESLVDPPTTPFFAPTTPPMRTQPVDPSVPYSPPLLQPPR